ncbi:MAG TPA: TolC family protein [Pirellulales bacterium]|nr:TolC family protein [Pirellulales bacterium]
MIGLVCLGLAAAPGLARAEDHAVWSQVLGFERLPPVDAGVIPATYEMQAPRVNEPIPAASAPRRSGPVPPTIATQPAGSLSANIWTLEQLVQIAEQNNPSIRKAAAQIQSARGDATQAGLYPNPNFDTNNPELIGGQYSALNVGAIQEIVVKGKLRLNRAAANQALVQAQLAYVTARFDALTEIRLQFYAVLAAERRLVVLRDLVQIAEQTRHAAVGRVQAGEGTETDVLLLTVELQRAEVAVVNAETKLVGLKRKLAATVGIPELSVAAVRGDLFGPVPRFDDEQMKQYIVNDNSEVQTARAEILRNRVLLRRAEVEAYPNPTIGPVLYWGLNPGTVPTQFGITVVTPLPLWNRNQGNIDSQRGDLAASAGNLGAVQNDLLGSAADTLHQHLAARQLADRIGSDILPNAKRSQELVRSGFNKGLLDISTLLAAQKSLIQANLDYIDALEDVWTTAAELAGLLQRQQFP